MERAELLAFINHIWPPVLALHRWSVAEWGLAVDRVVVLKLNFRSSSGTSLLVSRGMGQVYWNQKIPTTHRYLPL